MERGTEVHKSCYKFLSTKNHYLSLHSISLLIIFCALQNLFSSFLWQVQIVSSVPVKPKYESSLESIYYLVKKIFLQVFLKVVYLGCK